MGCVEREGWWREYMDRKRMGGVCGDRRKGCVEREGGKGYL